MTCRIIVYIVVGNCMHTGRRGVLQLFRSGQCCRVKGTHDVLTTAAHWTPPS